MDAPALLTEVASRFEPYLDAVVPAASAPPTRLHAAMRHLLFPGGKRLRPAFALAACRAAGAPQEHALPMAAAAELVHSYSLVHDDLPCMDDDRERRGRPTVHVAFDEETAVLAGDALQALAFEVLAAAAPERGAEAVAAAIRELAAAAGSRGLVGGQSDDLAFAVGGEDEAARVESVHLRKSAALISASVVGGALLGGVAPERLAPLRKFGEEVGVAFQIADDLLDAEDEEAASLVRVLGAQAARERAEALLASALARIEDLDDRAAALRTLARASVRRSR